MDSTPVSKGMAPHRSFSKHKASDVNSFLAQELNENIIHAEIADLFEFADLEAVQDTEWSAIIGTINNDDKQKKMKDEWYEASPEASQYQPFCGWVNHLIAYIKHPERRARREISFVPWGTRPISATPGYADGEAVDGTSSSFKPDAVCVLRGTEVKGWQDVLFPMEFKRKDDPQPSKVASTAGASTPNSRSPDATPPSSSSQRRSGPNRPSSSSQRRSGPNRPSSSSQRRSGPNRTSSSSQRRSGPNRTSSSSQHRSGSKRSLESASSGGGNERPAKKTRLPRMACHIASATTPAVIQPNSPTPFAYSPTNDDIQLSGYVMETLAAVGNRMHGFGLAVNRPYVYVWYYDRSGGVRLQGLNVDDSRGFLGFVKFLSAIMYMDDKAFGFNPFFADKTRTTPSMYHDLRNISVDIPDTLSDLKNASLKLKDVLDRRTGLVGRATMVYRAQLLKREGNTEKRIDAVIKSSWQHVNREAESDILKELHEDAEASNYIVKFYSGWEQGETRCSCRRTKIGAPIPPTFHDRVLRHTVVEYLNPITKLSQPFHIRHIGWSVLLAIGFLNKKGWFHRDISIGNIGFEVLECGGVLVKLHDFDLSKRQGSTSSAPHWTGTIPFMSIELLANQKAKHQLGFDVEALMWTLLWIVRVYKKGRCAYPVAKHPLVKWFSTRYDLADIAANKKDYLDRTDFTNSFYGTLEEEMRSLIGEWHEMRSDQLRERKAARDHLLLSNELYGLPGFERIKTWMKSVSWDRPTRCCSCEAHCARD